MINVGPVYIDALNALWIVSNIVALVITLIALRDTLADRDDVRRMNGAARTLVAQGDVRRERLRLVVQALLLAVVVPGLFADIRPPLTISVVLLIIVPLVLLISSLLDLRDRRRLATMSIDAITAERKIAQAAESALARVAEAEESAAMRVKAVAVVTASELISGIPAVERGVAAAERTAAATERLVARATADATERTAKATERTAVATERTADKGGEA